jgi:hypothetical protein
VSRQEQRQQRQRLGVLVVVLSLLLGLATFGYAGIGVAELGQLAGRIGAGTRLIGEAWDGVARVVLGGPTGSWTAQSVEVTSAPGWGTPADPAVERGEALDGRAPEHDRGSPSQLPAVTRPSSGQPDEPVQPAAPPATPAMPVRPRPAASLPAAGSGQVPEAVGLDPEALPAPGPAPAPPAGTANQDRDHEFQPPVVLPLVLPDEPGTQPVGDVTDPGAEPGGDVTDPGTEPGGDVTDPGTKPGGDVTDPGTEPGGDVTDPDTQLRPAAPPAGPPWGQPGPPPWAPGPPPGAPGPPDRPGPPDQPGPPPSR